MTQREMRVVEMIGSGHALPGSADDFVVPLYLEQRHLRISVAQVDGRMYAFDDLCTCAQPPCPLSGGLLVGTALMCQCHGSEFDITTGAVLTGPATRPLRRYDVQRVDSDHSLLYLEDDGKVDDLLVDDWTRPVGLLVKTAVVVAVLALPILQRTRRREDAPEAVSYLTWALRRLRASRPGP